MQTALVLLAGGYGTRLGGQDKAQLRTSQGTLLDVILRRFSPYTQEQWIIRRRDQSRLSPMTIYDPGLGPVVALQTALPRVQSPWLFLAAVDHPFAPVDILGELFDHRRPGDQAVMWRDADRPQPFFGIYRTDALRALPPRRGLTAWLSQLHPRLVDNPRPRLFVHVDRPEDLDVLGDSAPLR